VANGAAHPNPATRCSSRRSRATHRTLKTAQVQAYTVFGISEDASAVFVKSSYGSTDVLGSSGAVLMVLALQPRIAEPN